ncbi:MAG TPA: ribose 5-phosphate isomerase B [Candidatus Limnocylindrales bacterium]|nr:ribose 5-phosphate isomerase B [Candidatus Limnocylindrales bacterium]
MPRRVLTIDDLESIPANGTISVPAGTIVTPLARDEAAARGITIRFERPGGGDAESAANTGSRTVAIGADHGGFDLKEELCRHLQDWGYAVLDLGTSGREAVDYPDFAEAVANAVARGEAWRGVVIDSAGIGSSIAANKVPGVRAALCYDRATARDSREHNDANVLSLGARLIPAETAREILAMWLETPFSGGRHQRRVDKIVDIEKRHRGS